MGSLTASWAQRAGLKFDPGTNVVDVCVRYLRRKIDDGETRPLIQTVRGFGYMIPV